MTRILLSQADVTELEEKMVVEALRSGWVAPAGPDVEAFESETAALVGVSHAIALASGTAALHLALLGVGVRPGEVVVVPTLTFAASANAVVHAGATPVFVDCLLEDGNVDPDLLLEAVDTLRAEGVRVAAVMTVDLFGRVARHDALEPELLARGIPLVEDAAEALGASRAGRQAGSFGSAAAISFNGNKIVTTSGGGMVLTDDPHLAARTRHLSTQAREPAPWYEHAEVGYNYRLSNLLAALGRAQLSRLDEMTARRRAHRERYASGLADVPHLRVLGRGEPAGDEHDNCWLTVLVLGDESEHTPAEVIEALDAADVEARYVWKPMHLQPLYARHRAFVSGAAERLFARGIALPSGSGLRDHDIDRVLSAVRAVLLP